MIVGLAELGDLARERMAQSFAQGVDVTTQAYVVADASRRPGSDWLCWSLCVEQGLGLEEGRAKVNELIKAHRRTFLVMAQIFPLNLVPRLLTTFGTSDVRVANAWIERPLPEGMVRTLLISGTKLGFGLMPVPVVS